MKGDFSRFTFDPHRHHDRVLMQQGRVQLDSDWNEQMEAIAYRHRTAIADIIGHAGAPRGNAGFGLRTHSGMAFDGAHHYFEISEGQSLRVDGPYCLDGWVKLAGGGGGTILDRPGDGTNGGFRLFIAEGRLHFERDGADPQNPRHHVVGTGILPTDRFVHLAVVCEDGGISLFIDGVLDAELRGGGGKPFDTLPLMIGGHRADGHPAGHFRGVLDHLRLWQRGFAAADIRRLRDIEVIEDAADLLSDWRFDRDANGELRDHGSRAHHGRHGHGDRHPPPAPAEPELWIGAGHYYIDGVLSQNERASRYDDQEDCPGLSLDDLRTHAGPYLAYLSSWDRVVTAIEEASLRETALGGADTALRTRIVSQVRLWPLPEDAAPVLPPAPERGNLRVSRAVEMPLRENHLYRVEIHQGGFAAGAPVRLNGSDQGLHVIGLEAATGLDCIVILREPPAADALCLQDRSVELVHPAFASMSGTVISITRERPGIIRLTLRLETPFVADAGIDGWRLRPIATFKWSEDNGAWAFAVADIVGNVVTLSDPNGMDGILGIGDWVEIVDDDTVLRGMPTPLRQIVGLADGDGTTLRLELDRPCGDPWDRDDASRRPRHPLLRRWDPIGTGTPADPQATPGPRLGLRPIRMGETILLDGGVSLEFGTGGYDTEDYWLIPLRQSIEWPMERETPLPLAPHGPMRRQAELAQLWAVDGRVEIRDLRKFVSPLDAVGSFAGVGPELQEIRSAIGSLARTERVVEELRATIRGLPRTDLGAQELRAALDALPRTELAVQELWAAVRDLARGEEAAGILPDSFPILDALPPDDSLTSFEMAQYQVLTEELCILGRSMRAPVGWRNTGARIAHHRADPTWAQHAAELPFAGPVLATGLAERIYCLWPGGALSAFDPRAGAGAWTQCRSLPKAELTSVALVATDHHLHVLAVSRAGGSPRSVHLHYDPAADTWNDLAPMPTLREGFAAAAMTGALLAAGGCQPDTTRPLGTAEVFLPAKNMWKSLPSLPQPVRNGAAATAAGRFYLFGGFGGGLLGFRRHLMDAVQAYSPATETWTLEPPLGVARSGALAAGSEDRLYVVGGECDQDQVASIELLDTLKDKWREAPQPWRRRRNCGLAIVDGTLYLLGGSSGAAADSSIEACRVEDVFYIYEKTENGA